jgi:hypothetical protein
MPIDLLGLLRRDHGDLQAELAHLLEPTATIAEIRAALDGVRLGLIAHAEAEDIVLGQFEVNPALRAAIARVRDQHRAQTELLTALVTSPPHSARWCHHARHLGDAVARHAREEADELIPALWRHVTEQDWGRLPGAFATERLRQLAMLQPSAPIAVLWPTGDDAPVFAPEACAS